MSMCIVAVLLSFYFASIVATDPRSVNIALETSLIFQPDEDNNASFINKIRSFIETIEQVISSIKAYFSNDEKKDLFEKDKIFSEFLAKLTVNIIKYDDKDLENVARILANEVENLLNDKEIFTENTRKLLSIVLFAYSRVNPKQIRFNLKNALDGNEVIISKVADKINKYFNESDKARLNDLIKKSDKFSNIRLESLWDETRSGEIRRVVKQFLNVLYEKFKTLSDITKIQLNRDIGTILEYLDMSKIYINDAKKRLEYRRKLSENNYLKGNTTKINKKDILLPNENTDILVKSMNSTKKDILAQEEENNNNNHSKYTDDFNFNKIDNKSVDLSTVLDELSRSLNI